MNDMCVCVGVWFLSGDHLHARYQTNRVEIINHVMSAKFALAMFDVTSFPTILSTIRSYFKLSQYNSCEASGPEFSD